MSHSIRTSFAFDLEHAADDMEPWINLTRQKSLLDQTKRIVLSL